MANPEFLSKRVKKKTQIGITSDRYEFLGLDQAEPDLGDPIIGPSSIGANPAPIGGDKFVLIADGGNTGKRYWIPTSNLSSTGLIPGSFTVFNNNIQVGLANSFNRFNFVGSGVTVDPVGFAVTEQTGIATIRITVKDLIAPGNLYSIPYHSTTGFLDGANNFVYVNGNVGLGSTQPTTTLDIIGNTKILGIVTASSFVGNLTGTATTATNLSDAANITTGTINPARLTGTYDISITGTATTATTANNLSNAANITTGIVSTSRLSGTYGISITGTATTANNLSNAANITTGIVSTSRLSGTYGIDIIGTATTANNVSSTININTSGIITASTFYGNIIGGITTTSVLMETLVVTGLSTFTNGPVFIGSETSTGTASQPLQVTGGSYISGNLGIGTTNPLTPLQVETYGIKTGVGTFIASAGISTSIDSFSVSSTNFKTAEYTVHIGFGSYIQAQKLFVMQNQTSAYSEEYAVMSNNSLIVSIGATISGGNCIIQVTPQIGISGLTTYRFTRETML